LIKAGDVDQAEQAMQQAAKRLDRAETTRRPGEKLREQIDADPRIADGPPTDPSDVPATQAPAGAAPPVGRAAARQVARNRSGDITGDGDLTIVDAMVLARRIEARRPLVEQWDFNTDGRVDRSDADAIALNVVSLDNWRAGGGN
jgi:hypothetical protein